MNLLENFLDCGKVSSLMTIYIGMEQETWNNKKTSKWVVPSSTCNYCVQIHSTEPAWKIMEYTSITGGTRWRSWLRHCATSRKVAGLVPDGVTGIFHWNNPSGRTMALGLTQLLTEMSTRNIFWGVKAACVSGWQPYHLHVPTVLKSGSLNLLEPSGPVLACNGIA